jgi:nucleotide-binding universal stress UspA family protein
MFDRILIAVDGSDCSRRAAAFGLGLADAYGATVEVVHAVEPSAFDDRELREQRREHGEEYLAAAADLADEAGVEGERTLLEGRAPKAIVRRAGASGADLVVLGRRGRGGLGERLLGSTAERVLRGAAVPVLVVPRAEPIAATGGPFERVLAPTDGSEASERAAPYAADVARAYGATLHVVNVVDVQGAAGAFGAGGVSSEFVEWLEAQGEEHVASYLELVREAAPELDASSTVVRGSPHLALEEYAVANDVDLIVLASTGESSLAGHLLGSTADRLLRVVDVPLLVVPGRD